jgi:hypothetical protein
LRRYFVEHCSWEAAAPETKDPRRVTDPSTLRRGSAVWIPLSRHFRSYVPRCRLCVGRWMGANFSSWVACGCAGELYSLVWVGAGPYGSKN